LRFSDAEVSFTEEKGVFYEQVTGVKVFDLALRIRIP
jgi:hypothetical protein